MSPKRKRIPNLTIQNSELIFKNFSGIETKFNPAGKRNFCIPLSDINAETLINDGWHVKWSKPKEDDDKPRAYMKVKVAYGKTPPSIFLIKFNGKVELDEESIHILDWADIESADMELNPYFWDMHGDTGITAYLKTLYVTLKENELEKKYRDIPEISAAATIQEDDQA